MNCIVQSNPNTHTHTKGGGGGGRKGEKEIHRQTDMVATEREGERGRVGPVKTD